MPINARNTADNSLFDAFSPEVKRILLPLLKVVDLPLGKILYEADQSADYVYFPASCIILLMQSMEDGFSSEIAVIGSEGMIGIAVFMGGESTPNRAVVRQAGQAYRLPGKELQTAFNKHVGLRTTLLGFTQTLITQVAQTSACNRHHNITQRLSRWLLLTQDRASSDQLNLTQELMSQMLGVRREGVVEAAGKLHSMGAIDYRRGKITITDRPMLEKMSCECYETVRRETARINDNTSKNSAA